MGSPQQRKLAALLVVLSSEMEPVIQALISGDVEREAQELLALKMTAMVRALRMPPTLEESSPHL